MGKSDPYVFNFYESFFNSKVYKKIGFFGFDQENTFTDKIKSTEARYFYDISLENWDINSLPYNILEKFDLIVCTRCAYFCQEPNQMISEFFQLLEEHGEILIDWGLGDHWRFDNFKVGWLKDGEQEWAYKNNNLLWSCLWEDDFIKHPACCEFERNIKKLGYESLSRAVSEEVPKTISIDHLSAAGFKDLKIDLLTLWPEKPQLYIGLHGRR